VAAVPQPIWQGGATGDWGRTVADYRQVYRPLLIRASCYTNSIRAGGVVLSPLLDLLVKWVASGHARYVWVGRCACLFLHICQSAKSVDLAGALASEKW